MMEIASEARRVSNPPALERCQSEEASECGYQGGSLTAATTSGKEVCILLHFNSKFPPGFPNGSMLCVHFLLGRLCFTLKDLCPSFLSSLCHSLHIFLPHLQPVILKSAPVSPINEYLWSQDFFLFSWCWALKVILFKALLSVPATAGKLKVLICIHKITREAMSSNCYTGGKKIEGKNE